MCWEFGFSLALNLYKSQLFLYILENLGKNQKSLHRIARGNFSMPFLSYLSFFFSFLLTPWMGHHKSISCDLFAPNSAI